MSEVLVIRTPYDFPMCCRDCEYQRGSICITTKKTWTMIKNTMPNINFYNENDEMDYDDFYCDAYNPSEYVDACEIICNNPSTEMLKMLKKIDNSDIIPKLVDIVNFYQNRYLSSNDSSDDY